jgi:hypothetical protein
MEIIKIVDEQLNKVFTAITETERDYSYLDWKLLKSKLSSKVLSEKLKINEGMMNEFESSLEQYNQNYLTPDTKITSAYRVALWLETICKNLSIKFQFELSKTESDEDISIKQVRAMELILRSLIKEQMGGNEKLSEILSELFKPQVIDKWMKSSDESGILSGTTFSELSNILLSKKIFQNFEPIFSSPKSNITTKIKDSLRFLLEDIRMIRNGIAHNKKLSTVQIEALNNHFKIITTQIDDSVETNLVTKDYFDKANSNVLSYLSSLKQDNDSISGYLEDINERNTEILFVTNKLNKKSSLIIGLTLLIILITGTVLYFQRDTLAQANKISESTEKIEENVKQVFNRFDQLEGALKSSNPIANPKTANDFIVNAYIYKNTGETAKSILMFKKYFDTTRNNKFDLYLDYYDALKYQYSEDMANDMILELSDKDMAKVIMIYSTEYGLESLRKLNSMKISTQLKNYLYVLKSSEIKHNYISYSLYPFYIKVIRTRDKLGKNLENIQSEFFNKRRPLQLLIDNQWSTLKSEMITGIVISKRGAEAYNQISKENDYWGLIKSMIGSSKETSRFNINSLINFSTNGYYIKTLKSMP